MYDRLTLLSVATLAAILPAHASAQSIVRTNNGKDEPAILVTAVARGQSVLESGLSTSALDSQAIIDMAARSAAELMRHLPGIRAEYSGGEGNANIAVRGLPVAAGGSKFVQLQEDGLPVLQFGDITFANADIFLRADWSTARVEIVRGGSASTFASSAPGAIINFITKTGAEESGSAGVTTGVNYGEYRLDFEHGGALGANSLFHIGGFYRQGEGPRRIGYDGNKGGQIRASVTHNFPGGHIRLTGKYLDDRAVGYLPNPVRVTGTDDAPHFSNLPEFVINRDSLHSPLFTRTQTLGSDNRPVIHDIRDGMRAKVGSVGMEAALDLGHGWRLDQRFRISDISGAFRSPFPASVGTAGEVAANLFGVDPAGTEPVTSAAALILANGPRAGTALPDDALVARIVLFNTNINSLDIIANDIRLSGDFALGSGKAAFTGGLYASRQTIDTDWLWTSHLLTVDGDGRAALVDARDGAGAPLSQNGTIAFGAAPFGDCCRRSYAVHYRTIAPFAALSWQAGALSLNGSIRHDFNRARGSVAGAELVSGTNRITAFDFDGNGTIDRAEARTSFLPDDIAAPVRYDHNYLSWSFGASYRLAPGTVGFARISRGGRANADRILFNSNNLDVASGRLRNPAVAVDMVDQVEAGIKYRRGTLAIDATGFHSRTEEQNFEATSQRLFDRAYRAWGLELAGDWHSGPVRLQGSATFTDARISHDTISPANMGNRPRRQAPFIWNAAAEYEAAIFSAGLNAIGTGSSFAQDSNQLRLPAYMQVNTWVRVRPAESLEMAVQVNNLFDVTGITEAEEASIPASGIVRARSINGRTMSVSARLFF